MPAAAQLRRSHSFTAPPVTEAVPVARRQLLITVAGWSVPLSAEALRDVELLASEVITNAVVHTKQACQVVVCWTGQRLRVEVADANPVLPESADSGLDATDGRRLFLVDALATAWGTEPDKAGGKCVWFEVATASSLVGDARLVTLVRAAAPRVRIQPLLSLATA